MRRALLITLVIALVLAAGAWLALRGSAPGSVLASGSSSVPTTRVIQGALELTVHSKGDLRASRSVMIQAPALGGGLLRILRMVETGTAVRTGDVILEFDPAEQQHALEQAQSQVLEADQQILKLEADRAAQIAQDRVELLTAQFDVRRAELDARLDRDLVGASEFQRRQLSLEEARRRLEQVQRSVESRAETSRAGLAVAREARTKAQMAADRAQQNIDSLVITASMDGFVVARDNRDATGGFISSGMLLPEYRAGDTVFPGRPVADIFDLSEMEIRAKVNEQQRNNVAVGQAADVTTAAVPGETLTAKVSAVSGMAQSDWWRQSGPLRDFDVTLRLDGADARLRPGISVELRLAGTRIEDALHVPRQAIFERNGTPVVYVRTGERFEPREVKPTHRSESRVAIEGVDAGTEVALVNPDEVASQASRAAAPPTTVAK
jgi:multidrug resistance efflux pump